MERMHSLLRRQMISHFGSLDSIPSGWEKMINSINEAYWQMDMDREMPERSLELSSQELLQTNSEMRAVFQAFPDLLFRTDSDGTILDYQNSGWTNLWFSQGQVVGKHIHDIFPASVGEKFSEAINQVQKTRSLVSVEYSVPGPDRESFYEARLLPLLESQIVIIIRDITIRKYAEEALLASEERYSSLFDGVPVGLYRSTPAGQLLEANLAFVHMLNYPDRQSLLMVNTTNLYLHPEVREHWQALIKREDVVHDFETQFYRYDGSIIWVRNNGRAVKDSTGQVLCYEGILEDITNHKLMEEEVRESEQRLYDIINFLPDATFAVDHDGKVIAWNRAIEEMTGVLAEDTIGKGNYEYALPFYGIRRPILIDLVFRTNEEIEKEYLFVKKEGDVLLAEADVPLKGENHILWGKAGPLYNSKGYVVGAIESIRDITSRIEMEAELLKSQKLESIGILAGGIAHDFNNLLAAIIGYIDLAKLQLHPNDKVHENLERAEKSCRQASELTKRLITFSKGGEPLRKVVNIDELIRESCDIALRSSNVQCRLSLPDDLWPVLVDEGQIKQVVHGLVMNAKEAMPDGGIIAINAKNRKVTEVDGLSLEEGTYVRWSVTDHGIGIPRENLSRIFDPYFTTKNRESTKGMGLGLAICYSIIKRHDGLIAVSSEPGLGTTFTIYLPAAVSQDVVHADDEAYRAGQAISEGVSVSKGNILFMDDEAFIRDMMENILSQLGYSVKVAADSDEAISLYTGAEGSDHPFTLAILDLTVREGMGGEFVIRKLLQINPGIRAIVVSGYTDDHILTNYRKYGFKGALTKPFSIEKLKEVLNEALSS